MATIQISNHFHASDIMLLEKKKKQQQFFNGHQVSTVYRVTICKADKKVMKRRDYRQYRLSTLDDRMTPGDFRNRTKLY